MIVELTHTHHLKSQGNSVVGRGTERVRSLRWEQLLVPGTETHVTKESVCERRERPGQHPACGAMRTG